MSKGENSVASARINVNAIPAADMRVLCSDILDAVTRFYANPDNQRQFEIWRAKRQKEEDHA